MRYSYKCGRCGYIFDAYHSVQNRNKTEKCPECLGPAGRCFREEIKGGKYDALMKENERWSWSMGVNSQDIPEAMKQYPGSEYDHMGRLKIKSRSHKLFELKRRGMIEY